MDGLQRHFQTIWTTMRTFWTFAIAWVTRMPLKMLSSSSSALPARMPRLPSNVVKYSQVPKSPGVFTKDTIPKGLLKQHTTKKGTWGVICVSQGQLRYTIQEPEPSVHILDTSLKGIVEPTMHHQVSPITDDVEFVVEFHRVPGTGPVDEKRE